MRNDHTRFDFGLTILLSIWVTSMSYGVTDGLLPIWSEVRTEASRPSNDPIGRPLPLAATWQTGYYGIPTCGDPNYLIQQIDSGNYILPSMVFPNLGEIYLEGQWYYETPLAGLNARNLPICFIGPQWEQELTWEPYLSNPMAINANVFSSDTGLVSKYLDSWNRWHGYLDPMGPVSEWQAIGSRWVGGTPIWTELQNRYPNPPMVMLLSNNETPKLWWTSSYTPNANTSKRFVDAYGIAQTGEFKRAFFGNKWIELYRAMQTAMRNDLTPAWGQNVLFVAYTAGGPSYFRRWPGWLDYSLSISNRIAPDTLMWDGGSPSYYNSGVAGDYQVWSCQTEAQNTAFIMNEGMMLNPNFWFEYSVWDENAKKWDDSDGFVPAILSQGQTYTPDRYKGWIQFGMWINRPRAVREFRYPTERRDCNGPDPDPNSPTTYTNTGYTNEQFFLALCDAVNKVHKSPTLRSFWRKGTLVQNAMESHPYQDESFIPVGYDDATINATKGGRWFMLTASVNPPRATWTLSTEIYVYSLALVKGTAPNRQWLVYAWSPRANRSNVGITLPGYGQLTLNVPKTGQFWTVNESTGSVAVVNDISGTVSYNLVGKVILDDYSGDNTAIPVTVELRNGTVPFRTDNVTLDSDGKFTLSNVPVGGPYTLRVKSSHWLAKQKTTVAVSYYDLTDLGTINLINGDVDENNVIDISDLNIITANWGGATDSGDLNGDGTVDSTDLDILANSWNKHGDN